MAIIDADAHVLETERTWDYMLEAERSMRPRIVPTPNDPSSGGESWLIDGTAIGKARNVGYEDTSKESREMADIKARLKHMDELGVDVQVLYPTVFLRPFTRRPEVELAVTRSYNRWLIDIWKNAPKRLRWVAVLPLLSMDKALAEARFAKENGACGIFMRGLEGDKRVSDSYFFPLYEEAGRLNLPVCVHSATGSFAVHEYFLDECGFNKFKLAVVGSFHSLIFNRVPEKFPNTKWGFIEVSAQWVPYAIHDFARRFERQGRTVNKSEVLRKNKIWVACQTDDDLPYVLKYSGDDMLVIGTDYGHNDTSSEILALRKLQEDGSLPPPVVRKILDDNARALYGL
ncbi:MAG: amidohydrolase [Deltaproteobacteria bacterium]|nr:amidohydrolase [Deltaproteobacteria bacterium]MBI2532335.1 amidohydrolase [Deltaproteobacteria bacterium]MBI3064721.1 amidohydrolase [Deltaproteobacteria bacterium]